MRKPCNALLAGLVPLFLLATATAQTRGVNLLNRAFVVTPGGGAAPPPLTPSCPPPIALPAGVPVTFRVQTAAAGMPVLMIFDIGPCAPGFMCLAPVPVAIPPCLGPCGPGTNQSLDLAPPFMASVPGVTALRPSGVGGGFIVPFVTPAAPLGVTMSVQAVILDPAMPAGYLISNAYSVLL